MSETELRAELDHHDRVRAAMAAMRDTTAALAAKYQADYMESRRNRRPGDAKPDQNMGFAMGQFRAARLDDLADRGGPLFFGRVWLDSGESYHLGRRHVRDDTDRSVPLVVDWRAPLAERFYRASAHHRMEVDRRRRFGFSDGTLSSFEDEDLRLGQEFASDLLTAEIERPRTGPMRDIVATIQPEQDELIRRDADTSLCVQGAPGTGKTAVGLHRAAWLLYTYPSRLGSSGMLVVGPNEGFLRYISGVLPTLGETAVSQLTAAELTGAVDAPGSDPDRTALVKHDARMVEVCARAVWSLMGSLDRRAVVPHAGVPWTVEVDRVAAAVERARTVGRTWGSGRKHFEQSMVTAIRQQAEDRTGRPRDGRWVKELKQQPVFKAFIDHVWPRLTAKQVLRKLYTDAAFRTSVCGGLLTDDEASLLHGKGASNPSAADLLLLDEIQSHLGHPASVRTYGHIVVDEAQDLSPLECRAIARRCPNGSLTVLGDLAQGTTPWATTDWATQMAHLSRVDHEHTQLTDGFRVPEAIIELANRVLPHLGVSVPPARSMRSDGTVETIACDHLTNGTVSAVEKALVEEGMIGIIAPEATLDALRPAMPDDDRLELVPAHLAKGLEFDHVIVVEPADFVAASVSGDDPLPATGLRHLYVAVTRAVSRLTVVHSRPLPSELAEARP